MVPVVGAVAAFESAGFGCIKSSIHYIVQKSNMHAFLFVTHLEPQKIELKDLLSETYETVLYHQLEAISEVREFKKSLLFSPQQKTLWVISGVDEAKEEAQNALLKLLEEPPHENLLFLLIVKNESRLIPTIMSRLTKVKEKTEASLEKREIKDHSFLTFSKVTDRDEAVDLLSSVHTEKALETVEALKKNGNVTLHLTNYLLK
jgi:hypothetical protein